MKRLLTLILINSICVINSFVISATVGDYRTAQSSVTWSTAAHWQTWDGSSWSTASSPPGSTNDVYIQSGHTATLSANASCNSIYLSTGDTSATTGSNALIQLQTYTLSVYGNLYCYYGNIDINNGSTSDLSITYSVYIPTPPLSKSAGGLLKLVGTSRNVTSTGKWGAGSGSSSLFDIEFALNSGETATIQTSFKAYNWTISSGILDIGTNSISADNGTLGQADVTVAEGAVLISSGTGVTNSIIQRTSASICGTFYLNGTLKTSALSPHIQCSNINVGSNGAVEYSDNGNQNFINCSFSGAAKFLNYKNIILSGSGNKSTLAGENTQISSDGTLTIKSGTLLIGGGGNFTVSASNSTLVYQGSSAQSPTSTEWNTDFQNLKINNSAGVSLSGFSRTLNGKLYLISGAFSNGSNLTMGNASEIIITDGSLSSAPTFGSTVDITYNQSTAAVNTGNEIPASSSVLNNLTINNSNGVTLNSTTTVNNTLTLTTGKITSSSSNLLVLGSSAVISGGSSTSFVNGPFKKIGQSDFTFPVGKGSLYYPVRITSNSGSSSDYFTIEYFNSSPSNRSSLGTGLSSGCVSSAEYWDISPNNSQTAVVTLYWNNSSSGITNLASSHLVVAHYNSGNWISDDNISSSGSSSAGSVTSGTVSTWGNFTFGSPNNQNPLPVTFLNFRIKKINDFEKMIEWSTATEINCLNFEIQKSTDSVNFESLKLINSKAENGNSLNILKYSFKYFDNDNTNKFFRIKQNDFNGNYTYSPVIASKSDNLLNKIFVKNSILYICTTAENNFFVISDISGKVLSENFKGNMYEKNLKDFKPGIYFISLNYMKPIKILVKSDSF